MLQHASDKCYHASTQYDRNQEGNEIQEVDLLENTVEFHRSKATESASSMAQNAENGTENKGEKDETCP